MNLSHTLEIKNCFVSAQLALSLNMATGIVIYYQDAMVAIRTEHVAKRNVYYIMF